MLGSKQVKFRVPKIECNENTGDEVAFLDWEEEIKTQMTTWMSCKVRVCCCWVMIAPLSSYLIIWQHWALKAKFRLVVEVC